MGVTIDVWESINTVSILVVFREKWYMVVAATRSFEVLRMYCLDVDGELNGNTGEWSDLRLDLETVCNVSLAEVCRTKAKSEMPPRPDVPELVDVSIQGIPGSLLGMMFAHDAIAPCNSNPVWIRDVACQLENPVSRRKALDKLELSLASGRHLDRIIPALDSVEEVVAPPVRSTDHRGKKDDESRGRDEREPNSQSTRNKRSVKYDHKLGGPK